MERHIAPGSKILVIAVARIGDTLLITPTLRALKAAVPSGHLTVLAHPKRAEVLRNLPFVDQLATITKTTAGFKGWLSRGRYDHALVYGHDVALLRYGKRVAKHVVAFRKAKDGVADPQISWVDVPTHPMHAVDERAMLLQPLGVPLTDKRLAYEVSASERRGAAAWLASHFKQPRRPLVALQLVSFPTKKYRDWGAENFAALMRRIVEQYPEAGFVLLGGAADLAQVEPVAQRFPDRCAVAAGKTSLRESAALIAASDLYVGVDTGPTHLAGALGVPMVALYHSAHPGRNLIPLQNPQLRYLEHPATGGPATQTDRASMDDIAVDDVWRAVSELLSPAQRMERGRAGS